MKRKIAVVIISALLISIRFNANATNSSEYSVDFDWRTLFRHADDHRLEKYILRGKLLVTEGWRTSKGGYHGLLLSLADYDADGEYVLFGIDPPGFNLIDGDLVEVYLTITGSGRLGLNEPLKSHEGFWAYASAISVFDEITGEVIETFAEDLDAVPLFERSLRNGDPFLQKEFADAFADFAK